MVGQTEDLTSPERVLRDALSTGRPVDLRTRDDDRDRPANGEQWGPDRTIRAEVLARLLTEPRPAGRPRPLRLAGAKLIGALDLEAAELLYPLVLHSCWLAEPINLAEAVAPSIRLPGCHLPGLDAPQLTMRGNLELDEGFTATGEVRLPGAHIGGQLSFSGATLSNPDGPALTADGLTVDQGMFCGDGFTATGEVRLPGAHISGQLSFSGATLSNPDGRALNADGLTVGQAMFCRDGFTATGEVRLLGAHIGGQLSFSGATLSNPDSLALDLEGLRATTLFLRPAASPSAIDLTNAHVGALGDNEAAWPARLHLDGLTYDRITEPPRVSVKARLDWLRRDPDGYRPQPYEQLAAAYRRAGYEQDARRVLIAKQRHRRTQLPFAAQWWSRMLGVLIGYGYRTWQAGLWLLGLFVAASVAFALAHPQQFVSAKPSEPVPAFQPAIYALDVLLPVVDLRQETAWIPGGWARWAVWGCILAGWVLTTAVVAALTGILKRE